MALGNMISRNGLLRIVLLSVVATQLTAGTAWANNVLIQSIAVPTNSPPVKVGVFITNSVPITAIALPLELRCCDGAYVTGPTFTFGMVPNRRVYNSPLGPAGPNWPAANITCTKYAVPGTPDCSTLPGHSYSTSAAQIDFVCPDAVFCATVSTGIPGIDEVTLAPGTDGGAASFEFTLQTNGVNGAFVIDTCCVRPANHLAFVDANANLITPSFTEGVITVGSGGVTDCCYATTDINGDGTHFTNADLQYLIDFVNNGGPAPVPLYRADLNGDGFIDYGDIAKFQCYFVYGISCFPQYPVPVDCNPDTVRGACCEADTCRIRSQANCDAVGGLYWGDGSDCTPNPCECVDRPPDMVAWYTGDNTTPTDLLGQHDGTYTGFPVSSVYWKVGGGALEFHAPDTYVIVPDGATGPGSLNFGTGDFSIDMWVKTTANTGIQSLIDKRVPNGPISAIGYSLFLLNGNLSFQLADPSGHNNYNSTLSVADGNWHFVAATVDRDDLTGLRLTVDGNSASFSPLARQGNLDNSANLWIGARQPIPTVLVFDGLMDEIEIFNRALTPAEVDAIHLAGSSGKCKCTDPPMDMVAWWPLDETLTCDGCPVQDVVAGLNNGVQFCNVTSGPGEVDGALRLTRAGLGVVPIGSVVVPPGPTPLLGSGSFTIDAWIYPEPCNLFVFPNTHCHPRPIVSNRPGVYPFGFNIPGFDFFVAGPAPAIWPQAPAGTLGLTLPNPASTTSAQTILSSAPGVVVDNVWQHVAVRVNAVASTVTFFHNGASLGSVAYTPVTVDSYSNVNLGHSPTSPGNPCSFNCGVERYFNGWLDEIEIFSRALDDAEIAAIYGAGIHGKCKPAGPLMAAAREGTTPNRLVKTPAEENVQQDKTHIGDVPIMCPCIGSGDPVLDGVTDVLDVVTAVGVAFRGLPAMFDPECPAERTDVDCNGVTDVLDVVLFVGVAFRGQDITAQFCDPDICDPYPTNCP